MAATAGATITGLSLPPVIASNGPIKSGAGNFYVFGRDPAALNAPHAFKTADPVAGAWAAMSTTGRSGNSGNIEAIAVAQHGDLVHVFTHQGLARVVHNMFDMGTDAWVGTSVVQAWSTSTPTGYAWADAVVRSNGSVVLALTGPATSAMSGFSTLKYCLRDTAGAWTTNLALDSGGSIHWSGPRVMLGDADRIHFVMRGGGGLYVRTLLATNTLQAMPVAFDTAISADIDPLGQGISFVSDALHRVRVPYKDGSGYASVVLFDSSDSPTFSVEADVTSTTVIRTTNSASLLGLVVDGTTQHLVYADSTLQDLFRRQNAGAGWSAETNEWTATINAISARVLDRSGAKIALIVDNGGTIQYAEVPLGAVGTAITKAIGDSLAPSEGVSNARGLARTTADALAPTEASATSLGVSRTVGENLSPTEAVASGLAQSRAVGDALSPTEAVSYIRSRVQTVADTLSPTETVSYLRTLGRGVADILSSSESVSYLRSLGRGVSDSTKPVEAVGTVRSMVRGVADTLLPTETASAVRSVARGIADALSPTESIDAEKPLALTWGVNLAGGEFGGDTQPGVYNTDYTYPNLDEMTYYSGKNLDVVRVPFTWERVQRTRGGVLHEDDMVLIDGVIANAQSKGLQVLLDMHNFGRRIEGGVKLLLGKDIPNADFADVWTKIANRYKGSTGIFGYGLMNEPHDMVGIPGTFSGTVRYDFDDGTVQGWAGEATEQVAHVTTPTHGASAGALRATKLAADIPAGTGYANIRINAAPRGTASGNALRTFIRKPAGIGGTWRARVEWQSGSPDWTWHFGTLVELVDDTWVEVSHDFTDGFPNLHAFGIQIETGDAPDNLDAVFYIDSFAQGTITGRVAAEDIWPQAAQAATDGIRTVDTTHRILVAGDHWGGAWSWRITSNENLAINDPGYNLIYEAHQYFDADHSGKYVGSYDAEGATPTIGVERVQPFLDWCTQKNVQGYIGEYGVPRDDDRWFTVMDNFLKHLKTNGMGSSYWAGGPWWPLDDPLSIEPTENFTVDKPQMNVLESVIAGTPTIFKQVGDLLAPAENLVRVLSRQVTVGDALSPVESLSRALARSVQVADSLSPTEVVASAVSRLRSVGDALSPTETVARGWILGKSVVDTLSPSEAVSSAVSAAIARVVGDAVSPVDAPSTVWPQAGVAWPKNGEQWPLLGLRYTLGQPINRTVSDTLLPVDAPSTAWPQKGLAWPQVGVEWPAKGLSYTLTADSQPLAQAVGDALSPTEIVARAVVLSRSVNDALTPIEAVLRVSALHRSLAEILTPVESVSRLTALLHSIGETLSPVEAVTKIMPLGHNVGDTLAPVETVVRIASLHRIVGESLSSVDSTTRTLALRRLVGDVLWPMEATAVKTHRMRLLSDSILPAESIGYQVLNNVVISDAIYPQESFVHQRILIRLLADSLAPVDSATLRRDLLRVLTDAIYPREALLLNGLTLIVPSEKDIWRLGKQPVEVWMGPSIQNSTWRLQEEVTTWIVRTPQTAPQAGNVFQAQRQVTTWAER